MPPPVVPRLLHGLPSGLPDNPRLPPSGVPHRRLPRLSMALFVEHARPLLDCDLERPECQELYNEAEAFLALPRGQQREAADGRGERRGRRRRFSCGWDWEAAEELRTLEGHGGWLTALQLVGDVLVSGGEASAEEGEVKVWGFRHPR